MFPTLITWHFLEKPKFTSYNTQYCCGRERGLKCRTDNPQTQKLPDALAASKWRFMEL